MPRLPKLFILVTCFMLLVTHSVSPVLAQSSPFDVFWSWLVSGIVKNEVNDRMREVNMRTRPPGAQIDTNQLGTSTTPTQDVTSQNTNTVLDAAIQYDRGKNTLLPRSGDITTGSILDQISNLLNDLALLVGIGSNNSDKFEQSVSPKGVNDQRALLSDERKSSMPFAYSEVQCANLPNGASQGCLAESLLEPVESMTPTPILSPDISISPVASLPPLQSGILASCGFVKPTVRPRISRECVSNGYCSVACLVPFWGNDMQSAKIAAYICRRESGGDPFALNDRCDPIKYPDQSKRQQDMSMGFFQINTLAHCPGALINNWKVDRSCRLASCTALNQCLQNYYYDPIGNIQKAVELSRRGASWCPWCWKSAPDAFCRPCYP